MAGIPGAVHDASIWGECNLLQRIVDGEIMKESTSVINGFRIRPFILGDAAYPVRNFLVAPFK